MPHTIEPAASGRAKCHGCGEKIAKGELRFGERLPNPFADGEMTHWFHLRCGAYKRPEPVLEVLSSGGLDEHQQLRAIAEEGLKHRRASRVNGIERSPSGRARCRSCKELIEKDAWRIPLVFHEEGRFSPAGFIHLTCAAAYLGTTAIVDRILQFSGDLAAPDLAEIQCVLDATDTPHEG